MFQEVYMTSNSQPNAVNPAASGSGMRSEIGSKWSKFSAAEIAAIKDKDDLVTQVQARYSLDRAQAQRDVDAFAKGRQL
jgi:hypothetical protein